MIYLGVDPGMTGAVAVIWESGGIDVRDFETLDALVLVRDVEIQNSIAFVEKVHLMKGQGISSGGKFMKATGRVIGWIEALGIPYEEITPQKWQKIVFDSGTRTGDNKADSLAMARKLFPSMIDRLKRKKDHNRADALLIAEACRRSSTKT
jgi:hypothetical protein